MAVLRDGRLVADPFTSVAADEPLPAGPVIVGLARFQAERDTLLGRGAPLGVRLASDQHPQAIAADVGRLAVVALEFPKFRDGRAYTYARLLRERYGFAGELRAVGDVLQEQLTFMRRCGFDSFELQATDPEAAWAAVAGDHTAFYQGTGASPDFAWRQRHRAGRG
jgi:uncharacterized protein (DUF934 family)